MESLSRREMLMWAGASAAGVATIGAPGGVALAAGAAGTKEYTLPPLPYEYNALEPVLDEKTMRIHHDKHHAGYVKGLNATLQKLEAARKAGDFSAVQALSRALAFHGSGHVLHSLYWENLNPEPSKPGGALHHAINDQFGGFETMTAQLAAATNTVAGSGWGLLAYEPLGKRLLILQIEKHENQMFCGATPILVIDVWEHAYYLKYQNMRADYVKALMKHVNWDVVTKRYDDLIGPQ